MRELLRVSSLWGGYKEEVDVLQGIDMSVQDGETVGIIGLNGSGKSTLGKAIMNMIPFRKGRIKFNGEDVTGLSTHELARKGLAIMQQGGQVFRNLSVWENMEIAYASGSSLSRIKDAFPLLQRPKRELQHLMADKLSGGQKHELALVMAFASDPKLIILDEPSAGLSPKAVEEMYGTLRVMRERMKFTVLLIEQNVAKALSFCDMCHVLQQGKVIESVMQSDFHSIDRIMFNKIGL